MQTRLVGPGRSYFSALWLSGKRIRFREILDSVNDWIEFGHSAILMLIFELPAVGRTLEEKLPIAC